MSFYKIVSDPFCKNAPAGYKGIYRCDPCYHEEDGNEIYNLWDRYIQYYTKESPCGISDELTIGELCYFCNLLTEKQGIEYELLCIDRSRKALDDSYFYYGVDVSSIGGYSVVGEGFFSINPMERDKEAVMDINRFFRSRLNQFGLFSNEGDAKLFLKILTDFRNRKLVEPEDSFIFHIARVPCR